MCSRQARNGTTQNKLSSSSSNTNHSRFIPTRITDYFSAPNQSDQQLDEQNESSTQSNEDETQHNLSSLPTYYNNVRSITNKRNIAMKIDLSIYKVLCFTETWLGVENSSSVYFPSSFNVYRCDRVNTNRRAGGVVVLVHRSIKSRLIPSEIPNDPESEFIAVEVTVQPKPIIYYVCYMSVFDHRIAMKHHQRIKSIVDKYRSHNIIVIGDFNLHDLIWTADEENANIFLPHAATNLANDNQRRSDYNEAAFDFLNQMMEIPFFQLSNIQNSSNNVLDLLFTNTPDEIVLCNDRYTIIEQNQQDVSHVPFEINIDCIENTSTNPETKTVYCYGRGNYDRMCLQLEAINFQHEFNVRDVDSAYDYFINTMNTLIESNVPKKTIKMYSNKPKWWTAELQRLKNLRDKMYKRKPKGVMTDEYEDAVRSFNELYEHLNNEYIRRVQDNVTSNPTEFWNFAKLSSGTTISK